MAFENTRFRQCSYNYNNPNNTGDSSFISTVSKDIGNTGGAEDCIKIDLTKLQTQFNEDVSITQQIEVFFQAEQDVNGNDILGTFPVRERQGLFRLPQELSDGSKVYIAERSDNNSTQYAYLSKTKINGLTKTTKPDGSPLLDYDGNAASIIFPTPEETSEYTIKRLTHSFSDFVVYQPGAQLTSNLLNFQKGQEMFLIQELLWTIEMDMVTFSDLSGLGSIVTTGSDGKIPVELINLSIFELNDVDPPSGPRTVIYKNNSSDNYVAQSVSDLLNLQDVKNVNYSSTPTTNHVLTWDGSNWVPKAVSEAAASCSAVLAATLNFCEGDNTGTNLTDIFTSSTTSFNPLRSTLVMTESGLTKVPLNTLSDVEDAAASNNDILQWHAGDGEYKNVDPSTLAVAGSAGGDTFRFEYDSTTTSSGIGTAEVRFNSTGASITEIYVDDENSGAVDMSPWFESFNATNTDGVATNDLLKIFKNGNPEIFVLCEVTSIGDNGSFITLTVSVLTSSGTFTDADSIYLSHIPSGLKGLDGDDGQPGGQGEQGEQGDVGASFDAATVELTNGDSDILFTWEYPSASGLSDVTATLEGWASFVDTAWYYVTGHSVNGYGEYSYDLDTTQGGGGTSISGATNTAETPNSGTNSTSARTFQGIEYNATTAFSLPVLEDERVYGVNQINNDLIKLMPIPVDTRVLVKTDTNSFCLQNVIKLVECAT